MHPSSQSACTPLPFASIFTYYRVRERGGGAINTSVLGPHFCLAIPAVNITVRSSIRSFTNTAKSENHALKI